MSEERTSPSGTGSDTRVRDEGAGHGVAGTPRPPRRLVGVTGIRDEGAGHGVTGAPRPPRRLVGVDAARGIALFGMVAVHTLPMYNEDTGDPTLSFALFGGHASALFATLAGVSMAFTTGGRAPHTGRRRTASRWAQVGRAAIIALVGFLLGFLSIPWDNILIYYGVLFLLAIPFLGLRIRHLLLSAALFALITPFLMQWSLDYLPSHEYHNPSLLELVQDPGGVVAHLLLTGSYPALPWMAFVCTGIALGRMNLADRRVQTALAAVGAVLAVTTWAVSSLALRLGGHDAIAAATPWMNRSEIDVVIAFGADPELPTTTLWWLLVPGAHSNTPFSLLLSLGIAVATLGVCLLLSRAADRVLTPLAAMGAMTFTLYVSHLLIMWLELFWYDPHPWFWGQIVAFVILAVLWQRHVGQGPLEKVVTLSTRAISRRVLARDGDEARPAASRTARRTPGGW